MWASKIMQFIKANLLSSILELFSQWEKTERDLQHLLLYSLD